MLQGTRATVLVMMGCAVLLATGSFANGPATSTNSPLPAIEEIHEQYTEYNVDGMQLSDGSIRVTISTPAGVTVYESNFPVEKGDGRHLEWSYPGDPGFGHSTLIAGSMRPTLTKMTYAAKDIVRMIRRGTIPESAGPAAIANGRRLSVRTEDNFGCDYPFDSVSCTNRGNCCDTHDACYYIWGCNALSWLGLTSDECNQCNAFAALCIGTGLGSTGQSSECCAMGNCGQERPPTYYFSTGSSPNHPPIMKAPDPGAGGGGGAGGSATPESTPWGTIMVGSGICIFPDGTRIPCG